MSGDYSSVTMSHDGDVFCSCFFDVIFPDVNPVIFGASIILLKYDNKWELVEYILQCSTSGTLHNLYCYY